MQTTVSPNRARGFFHCWINGTFGRAISGLAFLLALSLCWAAAKDDEVRNPGNPEEGLIPEAIQKLKLSAEQEKKVREIVRSYDGSISAGH